MKYIISLLILGACVIGRIQAQSEFENLLQFQQESQAAYTKDPKRATRRKLYKAEDNLMDYLKEQGYDLTVVLQDPIVLPIHEKVYPTLGAVVDSLQDEQEITVFGKNQYGYYKVGINGKIGYVYKLDKYLVSLYDYPLALANKYAAMEAKVDAILSRRVGHTQAPNVSYPCAAINSNGQRCGTMTQNASRRCHIH